MLLALLYLDQQEKHFHLIFPNVNVPIIVKIGIKSAGIKILFLISPHVLHVLVLVLLSPEILLLYSLTLTQP